MECACGCGETPKTPGSRFVHGHYSRTTAYKERRRELATERDPNIGPTLCACGCGGTPTQLTRSPRFHQFLSGHNSYGMRRGPGRYVNNFGYVLLRMPDHPHAVGGYVLEHRYLMEQKLGRLLEPYEPVHHLNHDKTDNRPENLELLDRHEHGKKHGRPKGVPVSAEHRQVLRERTSRVWEERRAGLRPPRKPVSDQHRARLSKAALQRWARQKATE